MCACFFLFICWLLNLFSYQNNSNWHVLFIILLYAMTTLLPSSSGSVILCIGQATFLQCQQWSEHGFPVSAFCPMSSVIKQRQQNASIVMERSIRCLLLLLFENCCLTWRVVCPWKVHIPTEGDLILNRKQNWKEFWDCWPDYKNKYSYDLVAEVYCGNLM